MTNLPTFVPCSITALTPLTLADGPHILIALGPGGPLVSGGSPGQIARPKPLLHATQIGKKRQNGSTLSLTDRPETLHVAGPDGPLVTAASPGQIAQAKGMRFPLEKTKTHPKAFTIGNLGSSFLPLRLDP